MLLPKTGPVVGAGATGIFVEAETTITGVPLTTIVGPVNPGGAFDTGILVEDAITMTGCPLEILTLAPGIKPGAPA